MIRTTIAIAIATAAATAQFTSPKGFVTIEGGTNHSYMLFSKGEMRWQAIDRSHVGGGAKIMRELAWRRDGTTATNSAYTARTMGNFEVNIGLSDWDTLQVANLDNNFKTGSITQVVKPRTLSVVDVSVQPPTAPATWTTVIKFDAPFIYQGSDPFLWEVKYSSNTITTSTDYSFDFNYSGSTQYASTSGTAIGTPCTSTGMTSPVSHAMTFYNHASKFRITRAVSNMPPNTPVFMYLDAVDSNLTVPGLCAVLHVLPTIVLPLGTTDGTGTLATATIDNIPYVASVVGQDLYFQYWGLDLGQAGFPLSLSAATKITVPSDASVYKVTRFYHYKLPGNTSLITSGPWNGGIVTRFQ
ncbi:MAG: hypothetical protein H6832_04875 [Planctomycetes bacterium]|nr:hypothetical protein [Planctomycetota bacterium]MCB9890474.1 hypothetical protein [Planctomycetota bacterium]MCB9917715.1 hypothetical protein [Planctomycetota bacterium]